MAGKRFHTEEHVVARKGDGLVNRSPVVKLMLDVTTSEGLDAIKGSPWVPSGVLQEVLPDVPRPILSRDDPGCAKCRKLSRNARDL